MTYWATDSSGNSSTGSFMVTVFNNAPVGPGTPSVGMLWPPNHKTVPISINGVTDADDDPVTIQITGIFQDEPTRGSGDGNTSIDGVIMGSVAYVRAERSGK